MKSLFAISVIGLFGCAVTQKTTPVSVDVDASVAKSQASALSTAVASAQADDGLSVAEALESIGDITSALVPQAKNGGRQRLQRAAAKAATACGCEAAAKSCTFSACAIGNATVSGTLAWSSDTITCTNLVFDVPASSNSVGAAHVTVDCAITYATGQLAGDLHTTGHALVEDVTYTWDATLTAKAITFTPSAFTGGSLNVDATVTTSSTGADDKSFEASALVSLP